MENKIIYLPGLNKQLEFLHNKVNLSNLKILVIGAGGVDLAKILKEKSQSKIELIVEDFDTLISSKLELDDECDINIKIMDFERTDYENEEFDLVFVQGSISNYRRNKIVKEIKRILKVDRYLCVGEIVKLRNEYPVFIQDIFDNSNFDPLETNELNKYYIQRNFEEIDSIDLTYTLKKYYEVNVNRLKSKIDLLNEKEKSYYKTVLNKIKHESNAYLKLGADKFIGFNSLLLKKK